MVQLGQSDGSESPPQDTGQGKEKAHMVSCALHNPLNIHYISDANQSHDSYIDTFLDEYSDKRRIRKYDHLR